MSSVGTFIVVLTATTVVGRDCLMFIKSLIYDSLKNPTPKAASESIINQRPDPILWTADFIVSRVDATV